MVISRRTSYIYIYIYIYIYSYPHHQQMGSLSIRELDCHFLSKMQYSNWFILLVLVLFHGLSSHGMGIDQASRLRGLRGRSDNGEWEMLEMEDEGEGFFDGGKMEDDLIEGGLPGQPLGAMFKQYAGYVTVNQLKGRSLFYYFAEAAEDSSSKPLLLWLNGGPGCSSLGVGAMVEIGPFGVNPDGKTLYPRQYAWNKVANTLFLESPVGVGFSYSNDSFEYNENGDKRTAQDTYTFLMNWFRRFPHYKDRDFYIMGESYAGFYIPELADTIVKKNMEAGYSSIIHLKGIMIGNGIMNDVTDNRGFYDYLWSHALISDKTHQGLTEYCKIPDSHDCKKLEDHIQMEVGSIDFYNIYAPVCSNSSRKTKRHGRFDPCEVDYVQSYLNLPQVQEALHANTTKLPYAWDVCSSVINSWKDSPSTMFPVYRRLISSGLPILIYSGDVDAVVSVVGTRYSINALDLKVIKPWHPWFDNTKSVGGYKVVYEGLTFATIRGAGHEVPRFQPRRIFALMKSFLAPN